MKNSGFCYTKPTNPLHQPRCAQSYETEVLRAQDKVSKSPLSDAQEIFLLLFKSSSTF